MSTGAATAGSVQRASKKGIWGWMLFDWAQQPFHTLIITFVFAPYFAAHVAQNAAQGQEYWGYAAGIGGAIIALTSPILGAIADATGPRKPWIFLFSIVGFIGCWMLWYAVPGSSDMGFIILAIVLALVGMEYAAVFNNAMMPTLVPRAELGRLSGTAWGLGYLGGLLALIIVLGGLSANPETGKTLFGISPLFGLDPVTHEGDRASGPLTALWYLIFVIPMFLWTPDLRPRSGVTSALKVSIPALGETLRSLPRQKSYFSFLLSSMFYRDALNALYSFGGIYAAGVLGWPIIKVGIFGILASITGALGAWLGGRADQRFGPKPVISVSIVVLILACLVIISTTKTDVLFMNVAGPDGTTGLPDIVFYIAGALIGAAGGSIQAASRTLLVDQVEPDKVTEAFGLYALSGRATSFIAPFAIAIATSYFAAQAGWSTEDAQRIGVTPIVALFLIGLFMLPWVKGRAYTLEGGRVVAG